MDVGCGVVRTCGGMRADGEPCRARAGAGGLCFVHDPALQGKRETARMNGGHGKRTARRLDKLTPATLRPLLERFIGAIDAVEAGTLEPRQAMAMAALGGVVLKFYDMAEMDARLRRLEEGNHAHGRQAGEM